MMLEQLKYKNHLNEVFEFGRNGIYIDTNELHDYEWTVSKKNNRISALDYAVSKRKLPVVIICETEAEGIQARNRLMEVTEKDVLAMQYGQIIIGDYYFKCFVTKSQKKDYQKSRRYMAVTLTLTTDQPYWVKETTYTFGAQLTAATEGQNLDYPHDFPYNYAPELSVQSVNNTGIVGTNFKLIIYGAASNPTINISGHEYTVNCDIGAGEYLVVESVTKRIYLVGSSGAETNKFKFRNRESYIFEKIPPGVNAVSWNGEFGFDVILYEERSEPKWT